MSFTIGSKVRRARKTHRCDMCNTPIRPGDHHHVSTNVYDDRVYDWRTCLPCTNDGVVASAYEWAGRPDEGVGMDTALEWAEEVLTWPEWRVDYPEARAYLARVCGGEGE